MLLLDEVLKDKINKSKNQKVNNNPNDYYKDDILYCGNCNKPKEVFIELINKKIPCICECENKKMLLEEENERKQNHYIFDIKYIDKEFQNIYFKDVENLEQYYLFAKKFVENFEEIKKTHTGLYIFGDTGNGKTYISCAIANELFKKGYKVMVTKNNDAVKKINDFDEDISTNFKNELRMMDLIVIDDFGTNRETDYQIEQVYNLINFLYSNKKIVIFTTNIPRKNLGEEIAISKKRIYDRIIEMSYGVYLRNEGYRKDIAKNKQKVFEKLLK